MIYGVLNLIIWPTLSFFVFYKGYHALCKGPNHYISVNIYYCSQLMQLFFVAYFLVSPHGSFNGVLKIPILLKCQMKFSLFLACVELLCLGAIFVLGIYCFKKVRELYG